MKKPITDKELRELYNDLKHKGKFMVSVAPKVGRTPSTVKLWFSTAIMTNDIPKDEETRKILKKELDKAPKRLA